MALVIWPSFLGGAHEARGVHRPTLRDATNLRPTGAQPKVNEYAAIPGVK
jgi:hypothetical protein